MLKKNVWKQMIGLAAAAAMSMSAMGTAAEESETSAAEASEAAETTQSAETETETEAPVPAEPVPVEVTNADGAVVFTLRNCTGAEITEAVLSAAETAEGETEGADGSEVKSTLTLTLQDGTERLFENVPAFSEQEPDLVEAYTFFYLVYTDEEGEEESLPETADEAVFEEPVVMYVLSDVYIRAESTSDSQALGVAALGSEVTVTGGTPAWYKVEQEELTGYISRAYLSEDQESADAAVAAEEAEAARQAAQAAAAAAAAQAAAQAAQSQGQSQAPSGQTSEVYEVSRQAFDDCDGSGHGYYEITYSDGSTAIEYY